MHDIGQLPYSSFSSISHQVIDTSIAFDSAQQALASIDNYQRSMLDNFGQDQAYLSAMDGIQDYVNSIQNSLDVGMASSSIDGFLFQHREIEREFRLFEIPKKKKNKKYWKKKAKKAERELARISKQMVEAREANARGGRKRTDKQQQNYEEHKYWWDFWQNEPETFTNRTAYDEAMRDKTRAGERTIRRHRKEFEQGGHK